MKKKIIYGILILAMWLIFPGCGKKESSPTHRDKGEQGQVKEAAHQKYHCPMHPTYTADRMGDCPICGMNLVPIPVTSQNQTGTGQGTTGLSAVTLPEADAQRLGLTYGTVELKELFREIRCPARFVEDETRQVRVTSRVEGWVDRLYVNVTGQKITKGAPLLAIYSPELVAAQQELLTAVTMVREFQGKDYQNLTSQSESLLKNARLRLKLWEISDKQIAQIEASGQLQKNLTLYAPASGIVMEKMVLPGQKIMAGEPLMLISDLSHIWGQAEIYETDLPYIAIGTQLEVLLPHLKERVFKTKIVFMDPGINPVTRTLKARFELDNREGLFKPDMYAETRLQVELGAKLTLPASAVLRGGDRDYVFVLGKDGQLQPVEVKIGVRSGDLFEMISGLYEGDKIVTSANFLIDSESSLKAALQAVMNQK